MIDNSQTPDLKSPTLTLTNQHQTWTDAMSCSKAVGYCEMFDFCGHVSLQFWRASYFADIYFVMLTSPWVLGQMEQIIKAL